MSISVHCASDCPLLAVAPESFLDDYYDRLDGWDGWDSDDSYDPYTCGCGCDSLDAYDDPDEEDSYGPSNQYGLSDYQLDETPWQPPLPSYVRLLEERWMHEQRTRDARDTWKGEVADYREWADAKEGYNPRITWRSTPTIWDRIFAVFPLEDREYKTPSKKRREADRNPRNARRDGSVGWRDRDRRSWYVEDRPSSDQVHTSTNRERRAIKRSLVDTLYEMIDPDNIAHLGSRSSIADMERMYS